MCILLMRVHERHVHPGVKVDTEELCIDPKDYKGKSGLQWVMYKTCSRLLFHYFHWRTACSLHDISPLCLVFLAQLFGTFFALPLRLLPLPTLLVRGPPSEPFKFILVDSRICTLRADYHRDLTNHDRITYYVIF